MLTGTIKADWIQLPVERYLAALPTLRHGVIAGVFRNKGAAPWATTRAEKAAAFGLPSQWFVIGWLVCRGLRPANCVAWRVYVGALTICAGLPAMTFTSCGRSMMSRACGATSNLNGDSWRVSLKPKGQAGIRSLSEKSGFLLTGRIGLVMIWKMTCVLMVTLWCGRLGALHRTSFGSYGNQLPPLEFPGEQGIFIDMYAQVREEEQVISPQFTRKQEDVSMRRTKEEEADWRRCPDWVANTTGSLCGPVALVVWYSVGGVMIRQGLAFDQWLYYLWSPPLLAYCTWRGLHCAVILIHSWKLECLDSSCSSTSAFYLDDVLMGSSRLARKSSRFTLLLLGIQLWWIAGLHCCWLQGIEPIEEVSRH